MTPRRTRTRAKAPAWTSEEVAVIREFYPGGGIAAVADMLPDRSWHAIQVMAHKLGVKSGLVTDATAAVLSGDRLERAIALREEHGWGFPRIGREFGVSEAAACNAILIALCPRKGFTPAQRDDKGRLTAEGLARLREALRKGMKGVDIQLHLGLSAGRVAEERRRYTRHLKEQRKVALPPPGKGAQYSGVKLSREAKREVEALFLQGLGTKKVAERSGVSHTSAGRIRNRLIKRLRRTGQTLPGCDRKGKRTGAAHESRHYITAETVIEVRRLILDRTPVRRAAAIAGVGTSSAYKIRDALRAELEAKGEQLPAPILPGKNAAAARAAKWLPDGMMSRFRDLSHTHGAAEAKRIIQDEVRAAREAEARRRAERRGRLTLEEQLAAVRNGAGLVRTFTPSKVLPDATLGGIATGMI